MDFSNATLAELEREIDAGAWRTDGALHNALLLRANALAAAAPDRNFSLNAGLDFYFGGDTVNEVPDDVAAAFFTQTGGNATTVNLRHYCDVTEVGDLFSHVVFSFQRFKQNFQTITSNDRYGISMENATDQNAIVVSSQLAIANLTAKDTGVYQCQALNELGTTFSNDAELLVYSML